MLYIIPPTLIFLTLFKAVNTQINHSLPSKLGYCLDISSGDRPEYCRCTRNSEGVADCRERCKIDPNCRGYSYRYTHSSCFLYTISGCTKDCSKGNVGMVGEMIEAKDNEESGCFMMDRSMFLVQ